MSRLFTSPSHVRNSSGTSFFDPSPPFSFASETSARQVTGPEHETRKRSRNSEADSSTLRGFIAQPWNSDSLASSDFGDTKSPPPLAHDRYELAGGGSMEGVDRFAQQNGDYDDYFALQKQREMWPATTPGHHLGRDGVAAANESKPWVVNSLLNIVGGVAGKLFEFCSVPFRGFQAGGGHKYNTESQVEIASKLGLHDDAVQASPAPALEATYGSYQSNNYGVQSIESVESERPRMAKRLRTADSWVVVNQEGETISRPGTPRLSERRTPGYRISPSQIPRPISRPGVSTPASKRPSLIPVSRRSTADGKSLYPNTNSTITSLNRQRIYSRQSLNSPLQSDPKSRIRSPLPPDSQSLINKVRHEELEDDARMRRMSSQMSAMLREAREALGAKIEIDDASGGFSNEGITYRSNWY